MQLISNDKLTFVIDLNTTFGESLTGGLIALHYLAFLLAEEGHNVYIFSKPEYPHPNIHTIPSFKTIDGFINGYTFQPFTFDVNRTISIYPQITRYNPFNTKHVVRWILYHTEHDIENTYSDTDYYFNFGDFKTYKDKNYGTLTVINYNFDKFSNQDDNNRSGFCHLFHKNTPPDAQDYIKSIKSTDLDNWKLSGNFNYLNEQFNKHEYFLTFDKKSFFTVAASLCGCKSIILNSEDHYEWANNAYTDLYQQEIKMKPHEYRIKNPLQMVGVAFGFEDLDWAKKTLPHAKKYHESMDNLNKDTVKNFIKFFEKKINQNEN